MHICFAAIDYHNSESGGGIASYVDTLGEALVARNHQVTVIAKGGRAQIAQRKDMQIVRVPLGNWHWYLYKLHFPSVFVLPIRELEWSMGIGRALSRLMERSQIDLVESCETGILFLANTATSALPLVVRLHGEPYVFQKYTNRRIQWGDHITRRLELMALRRAAAITSPSYFQAKEVAADLGWSSSRIKVIPNPISPFLLAEAQQYQRQVGDGRPQIILYVGRIEDRKGIIPLIYAISRVVLEYSDVHFVIAGGRHTSIDDRQLKRVLDRPNVRKHVTLLGHVLWRQVVELYRRATIFVMPSYYETFGISAIEAMAFGLPVVATTAGGLPEVIEDGITGLLVPPGDEKALAEVLLSLLQNPEIGERLGRAGRERVLAEFTVDRIAEVTLDTYSQVLAN